MRNFLQGAALLARFRSGEATPAEAELVWVPRAPETPAYVDARTEARTLCRNLGMDVDNEHWDGAEIGDFIRLAYAQGWQACESRLASPDMADAIAQALNTPASILERKAGEPDLAWTVRTVQLVVAHGVPKDRS